MANERSAAAIRIVPAVMATSRRLTPGARAARVTTGRAAIAHVLSRWHEPAPRLIWIYAVGIGAFYGTIQIVPLLLADRLGVTERTVGYFVMYMGGMGVVVRTLVLGRAVDLLGEARLARLGIVVLAAGLAATGVGRSSWARNCCVRTRTGTRWPTRPGTRSTCASSRRSRRPRSWA